jgi:NAD(P)-dependent dehydrogenase (short-subunit alcohol dehydrogenase family)
VSSQRLLQQLEPGQRVSGTLIFNLPRPAPSGIGEPSQNPRFISNADQPNCRESPRSGYVSIHHHAVYHAEMPVPIEQRDRDGHSLHGKVALVTGGAGAIGSAVVARLVAAGVRVVAVDQDRAPDPAAIGVNHLRGDIAHPVTASRAVATAEAAFGGLDLLVNAASGSHAGGLAEVDLTCWNRVLAVNLTGTLLACQAAVPAMRRRAGGVIVSLGPVHAIDAPGQRLAYDVSMDAVVALSRHLGPALEPLGIEVHCVLPDAIPGGSSPDKDIAAAVVELLAGGARRAGGTRPAPAPA